MSRATALPCAIALAYILAVPAVLRALGLSAEHAWWADVWALLAIHLAIGLPVAIARTLDHRLIPWLKTRAAPAIAWAVLCVMFLSAFSSWKRAFWRCGWFGWDAVFAEWDRWVHLGRYPHEWIARVVSGHAFVLFCQGAYFAWLVVVPVTLSCVLWLASPARCRQCLLTFLGVWIVVGSVLAPLLGSAGPIYYARLVAGGDPYAALVRALAGTVTMDTSEWLWRATNSPGFVPGTGISAMPSVHVGEAMLIALLAWTSRRVVVRGLGVGFLAATQLAAVALGWHYAIDGYVAIVLTWALWKLAAPARAGRQRDARKLASAGASSS